MDDVFSLTYEELRRLAHTVRGRDPSVTLNPTALVHEVWLKLATSPLFASMSPTHFKRIAARAMRQLLVEAARRRNALKRGGAGWEEVAMVNVADFLDECPSCDIQVLALHDALDELSKASPSQALMVELRYFGGLEISEIVEMEKISEATVFRELRAARAWLSLKLRPISGSVRRHHGQ